jgi:hypothetical protein
MNQRPIVLYAWNGSEAPARLLHLDAAPEFDLVLFDYSGTCARATIDLGRAEAAVLSHATQCKGELFHHFARWLIDGERRPEYAGLIDDDILIDASGLNRLLHIGRSLGLDAFAPALSHDSHFSHRWTLWRASRLTHAVRWIEVMMPVYRGELLWAAAPLFEHNISSWGIDCYAMPTVQKLLGMEHSAIVDAVLAAHTRPITSDDKVFRNGLTAQQEQAALRQRCIDWVTRERPELIDSDWYRHTFLQRHTRPLAERVSQGLGRPIRRWLENST